MQLAHGADSSHPGNPEDSFPSAVKEFRYQPQPASVSVGSKDHVHTLNITKSSNLIRPALMFSPTERKYS